MQGKKLWILLEERKTLPGIISLKNNSLENWY